MKESYKNDDNINTDRVNLCANKSTLRENRKVEIIVSPNV